MTSFKHIVTGLVFLVIIMFTFKFIKNANKKKIKEKYNGFNTGYGCFDGNLSVPLPGKSKCFDCEREMIARDSCNISAGALGNPALSFDAETHAGHIWGLPQFGQPSRLYSADYQL